MFTTIVTTAATSVTTLTTASLWSGERADACRGSTTWADAYITMKKAKFPSVHRVSQRRPGEVIGSSSAERLTCSEESSAIYGPSCWRATGKVIDADALLSAVQVMLADPGRC